MPAPDSKLLVQALSKYFKGRTDIYALQYGDQGYRPERSQLNRKILLHHVQGSITVGVYVLTTKGVSFGAIDIDFKGDPAQKLIRKLVAKSSQLEVPTQLEPSGRKGYHLWFVCKQFVNPGLMRHFIMRLMQSCQAPRGIEIFPKQTGGVALGNLIKLPFGVHQVTGKRTALIDPQEWKPYSDWGITALDEQPPITEDMLKDALSQIAREEQKDQPEQEEQKSQSKRRHKAMLLCYPAMESGVGKGSRDEVMFRLAVHYWDQGFTREQAEEKILLVNRKNQPPLELRTIQQKLDQAFTGRYGFGCTSPLIEPFCQTECPIYKRRNQPGYGQDVPDWMEQPEDEEEADTPHTIRIIPTNPPFFEVGMWDSWLVVSDGELLSLRAFKRTVFRNLIKAPRLPFKQPQWESRLNLLISQGQREHAPASTSDQFQMTEYLYEWLQSTPPADTYEEIIEGRPYSRNERWYFRGQDAVNHLRNRFRVSIGANRLWAEFVRGLGGNSRQVTIETDSGKRQVDLWWVPREQKEFRWDRDKPIRDESEEEDELPW